MLDRIAVKSKMETELKTIGVAIIEDRREIREGLSVMFNFHFIK